MKLKIEGREYPSDYCFEIDTAKKFQIIIVFLIFNPFLDNFLLQMQKYIEQLVVARILQIFLHWFAKKIQKILIEVF